MIPTTYFARVFRATALSTFALALPCFAQYKYNVLPPTPDLPNNGTVSTWTYALNHSSQVGGYEVDPAGARSVVVWTLGKPAKLPMPSGYVFTSSSIEINDMGQVLTNLQSPSLTNPNAAVLWTGSVPFILPPGPNPCVGPGPATNFAIDLNNLGHVLGKTSVGGCTNTYWIWDGTTFHLIPPPTPPVPPTCTPTPFSAVAINNKDEVIGIQSPPACSLGPSAVLVRPDGSFAFYAAPPAGYTVSSVTSVNDTDEVNATGKGPNGVSVALFWQSPSSVPRVIHSPSAAASGVTPGRLNNGGEFIFATQTANAQTPYLWNQGVITAFPPHGIVAPASTGQVNDIGQIAVTGKISGSLHWVRGLWMIPVP